MTRKHYYWQWDKYPTATSNLFVPKQIGFMAWRSDTCYAVDIWLNKKLYRLSLNWYY